MKVFVGDVDLSTIMRRLIKPSLHGYISLLVSELTMDELKREIGSDFYCVGSRASKQAESLGLSCTSTLQYVDVDDTVYGVYRDGRSAYRVAVLRTLKLSYGSLDGVPPRYYVMISFARDPLTR